MFLTRNPKAFQAHHCLALVALVLFYSANVTFAHNLNPGESHSDYILCRECGADVADAGYIFNYHSSSSAIKGNRTLFKRKNVDIQKFKNALGVEFEVVTVEKSNCFGLPVPFSESWRAEYSWYPEYDWETCLCPGCGHHIGWVFEPIISEEDPPKVIPTDKFYALILGSTISESYADSLVVIPKNY